MIGEVTVTAKRLLVDVVRDSGRRSTIQIPESFARVASADQDSTPLSRLFVKGEVPLKLYLTLLLLTRKPPHDVFRQIADPYWANLFGLEERSEEETPPQARGPVESSGRSRDSRAVGSPNRALISRRVERGRGLCCR